MKKVNLAFWIMANFSLWIFNIQGVLGKAPLNQIGFKDWGRGSCLAGSLTIPFRSMMPPTTHLSCLPRELTHSGCFANSF